MSIFTRIFRRGDSGGRRLTRLRNDRLIEFPPIDTKENYLAAFWRWVELLVADDYQQALESLFWPNGTSWSADVLKDRVTTFFGGDEVWTVIVPNERLVGVINDGAEFNPRGDGDFGWLMAHIPLTTKSADPKGDEIPLMGLACSFLVRPHGAQYVLEFEIFHV